ncbi:MAG: hemoglobin [Solirubrobacteraceae bacterium]|jgi:hemoglobin|nr:hemoglobin [Solirubrobacteraceae bacterium]
MSTQVHDAMYQQVGGDAGMTVLVDNFYDRLWKDPSLDKYFEGIDGDALKRHQRMFLTYVLGAGGPLYEGQPLTSAHATLNITDEAFDTVAHHLLLTLEELDIERSLIKIIMGFVEGARPQVVNWKGY